MTRAERYRKAQRLKGGRFAQVLEGGRAHRAGAMSVRILRNGLDYPRLGLAISRSRLPRAVDRNRVRRLLREWFRRNQESVSGYDLVVRLSARPARLESLITDMERILAAR